MATAGKPVEYLPAPFDDNTILSLLTTIIPAPPITIKQLKGSGQFHLIYTITYSADAIFSAFPALKSEKAKEDIELLLRISGNHFNRIKTVNEVAVITWLQQATTIPAPQILEYSDTKDNVLGQEWILFSRSDGQTLSQVFRSFSAEQMDYIIDQLIDVLVQLHSKPWSHVGGLCFSGHSIVPGPVLEESLWFEGEIPQFWPKSESFNTLNVSGPYESYTAYITAHVGRYIHAISVHQSLEFMRDTVPRLYKFLDFVEREANTLDEVPLRLAHKDLHFGNILVDPTTARITCILDWEFAGVVPYPRWDPSRAFLWNGLDEQSAVQEKRALFQKFKARCKERDVTFLYSDTEFTSEGQEQMHTVHNYLRAIVETCPRGHSIDSPSEWKKSMLEVLKNIGV